MFAVMDAQGWGIVIAAAGLVIMQIVNAVIAYKRENEKAARDEAARLRDVEAAKKVEAVKVALVASTASNERKVEEVKTALADTTAAASAKLDGIAAVSDGIAKTGEANHILLNNNMHLALAETLLALVSKAKLARELAGFKDTDDARRFAAECETEAREAELALHRHDEKQRTVDAVTHKAATDEHILGVVADKLQAAEPKSEEGQS
jgi:hypothetical protein